MHVHWILYREIKALQESEENHHVVRLHEVFPSGAGFVLVFDYMLSDLSSVLRNCDSPLTEVIHIPKCVFKSIVSNCSYHVWVCLAFNSRSLLRPFD